MRWWLSLVIVIDSITSERFANAVRFASALCDILMGVVLAYRSITIMGFCHQNIFWQCKHLMQSTIIHKLTTRISLRSICHLGHEIINEKINKTLTERSTPNGKLVLFNSHQIWYYRSKFLEGFVLVRVLLCVICLFWKTSPIPVNFFFA